jgi:hypothetical protein
VTGRASVGPTAAFSSRLPPDTLPSEINGLFTATERVGYVFNNWLPYIKGGYAGANLRTSNFDNIGGMTILEPDLDANRHDGCHRRVAPPARARS